MSFRTVDIAVSRNRLPHHRIEHPQANPLRLRCTLRPGESLPSALEITAEIHTSRNVPAEAAPLAATTITVGADATSFEVLFDSPQTNQTVTPESTRDLWLVMYGVGDADAIYTLATADLLLGWHAISRVTPPPPATAALVEKGGVAWVTARQYAAGTMVTVGTTAYVASSAHTSGSTTQPGTGASWNTVWAVLSGGGGGGATNLAADPSPTAVVITSSTGDAATIPAADGTNAGVMLPAQVTKLADLPTAAALTTSLSGKADLVDGKLNASQLPDLAVTQYLGTAANQAAMLLLVGQQGDWCVRLDDGKVYVVTAQPSSTLSNWTSLSYPTAPVLSVAGRAGAVTIAAGDITDSTPAGRGLLTAADAAAQRTALGLAGSIPAGAGTELQYRDSGALAALSGSSVSGSALTVAELRVNAGDAATGFRATHVSGITTLAFYGTGTNGFFYAQAGNTQVNYRGTAFRIEGLSGADSTALLQIATTNRVIMRARALNNLCLGPADAASPAAQSISVQSATGTNQSAASAVLCLDGAQGTGTGVGGDILFRVAPTGSTGATQNTLSETMRLRASDRATVCAGAVVAGGPVTLATFTVATVPAASLWTRGLIYVSDDVGGPTPAFSDGTNWRRVADRAVVSTP